ncbi:MAG: 4Fe-4S dicluster domain-containing protein [Bacteroidota bacterium]
MNSEKKTKHRYGMVIDLDKCTGCGACMVACAIENNVPPAHQSATDRTGITWLRVYEVENGEQFPDSRSVYIPLPCQQCGNETPCVSVCPQNAVEVDPESGIVGQIPVRCLGCRYCMTACPYHARYFNWWDPVWPHGMEKTLNPDVSTRMRGVVEKCNFCHSRFQSAKAKAASEGRRELRDGDYMTACAEACPAQAITFGDLLDEACEVSRLAHNTNTFRLLEKLGTEPKVYYHSEQEWVRKIAERKVETSTKEIVNG